jgi:hypothetical protein
MTSSSCSTGGGLKKCIPMTLSGRGGVGGELGDRERRGVGREDDLLARDVVRARWNSASFDVEVLVAASMTVDIGSAWRSVAAVMRAEDAPAVLSASLPCRRRGGRLLDFAPALFDLFVGDLDRTRPPARTGR